MVELDEAERDQVSLAASPRQDEGMEAVAGPSGDVVESRMFSDLIQDEEIIVSSPKLHLTMRKFSL